VGLHVARLQEEGPQAEVTAAQIIGRADNSIDEETQMRQNLTIGQMLLRPTGLTVMTMMALVCRLLATAYLGGEQFGSRRRGGGKRK
jgi:hypothetical protein